MGNKLLDKIRKDKKKWLLCAIVVVLLLVVLGVVIFIGNYNSVQDSVKEKEPLDMQAEGLEVIENIQGLNGKAFIDETELLDDNLTIDTIGAYNGLFVEDGSDEVIENALSIVVTNHGDQTLQIAIFTISDGENEYEFQATTLPAGKSVLVLEKNKSVYQSGKTYELIDFASGYFSETTLLEENLEITAEDGKFIVKNIGDVAYSKIYIYYKLMKRGGVYMGGITYRTPVENLAPGESQEVVAAHYRTESGHIIMVEATKE